MTPKIWARIEAIRAISHQFAQRETAIRWLEWLHRKLSINDVLSTIQNCPEAHIRGGSNWYISDGVAPG
jgi:hypothetical protein